MVLHLLTLQMAVVVKELPRFSVKEPGNVYVIIPRRKGFESLSHDVVVMDNLTTKLFLEEYDGEVVGKG